MSDFDARDDNRADQARRPGGAGDTPASAPDGSRDTRLRPPGLPPSRPAIPGTITCKGWSVCVWRHPDGHARLLFRHGGAVLDLVLSAFDRETLIRLLACPVELVPANGRLAAGSQPKATLSGAVVGGGAYPFTGHRRQAEVMADEAPGSREGCRESELE